MTSSQTRRPALAGAGPAIKSTGRSYPAPGSNATRIIGLRLSPRRELNAQRLLDHLIWRGRRLFLDDRAYDDLRGDRGLDRVEVNQAVDDLFALRLVDVHLAGNDVQVVTALADHLEQGAA